MMDGQHGRGPEDEADGAEQAFEALRAEVAALRRGVELVYREVQRDGLPPVPAPGSEAPDYTLTLGKMEKALGVIAGRLAAVERQPALQMTGAQLKAEIDAGARNATETLTRPLTDAAQELFKATTRLDGLFGRVHERKEQRKWLWTVGFCGMLGGVGLWVVLSAVLPWGAGDWMAALPLSGGNRWVAGQALLQRASPDGWDRMLRLYQACDTGPTALCEAAITVRTVPPLSGAAKGR